MRSPASGGIVSRSFQSCLLVLLAMAMELSVL